MLQISIWFFLLIHFLLLLFVKVTNDLSYLLFGLSHCELSTVKLNLLAFLLLLEPLAR